MSWTRRKTVIAVAVGAICAAVAVVLTMLLGTSRVTEVSPAAGAPPRQLYSPFTGEPVPRLGPVLAMKIDNIVRAGRRQGLARPTWSTCCR
jgi:hypothetical protein